MIQKANTQIVLRVITKQCIKQISNLRNDIS